MKRILVISLIFLAACAKQPEKIVAADIGPNPYTKLSCQQLAAERLNLEQALEKLSASQKNVASGDVFSVLLIGVPASAVSGNDKETQIAIAKGRLNAVEQVQVAKSCK